MPNNDPTPDPAIVPAAFLFAATLTGTAAAALAGLAARTIILGVLCWLTILFILAAIPFRSAE